MHQDSPVFVECFWMGDQKTIRLLVKLFYPELFKFSSKITNSQLEAEEIVQDAFVILLQNRTRFVSVLSIRKYLFKVVKNRSINAVKKNKTREKKIVDYFYLSIDEIEQIDEEIFNNEDLINKVWQEVEILPPKPQMVLTLILIGKSVNEISLLMKTKESTIRSIKHRAIASLKKKLKKM